MKRLALLLCLSPLVFADQITTPDIQSGQVADPSIVNVLKSESNAQDVRLDDLEAKHRTDASGNVSLGTATLDSNTTGGLNTAIGNQALQNNDIGNNNTAVGFGALLSNVGGTGFFGEGSDNVAIGTFASTQNTTGKNNVAIGSSALKENQEMDGNVSIGYRSLKNFTGSNQGFGVNVAIGNQAMELATYQQGSVAIGGGALESGGGIQDVAIGNGALKYHVDPGTDPDDPRCCNVAIGATAGFWNKRGKLTTLIGHGADVDSTTPDLVGATAIGAGAEVDASFKIQLGSPDVNLVATSGKLKAGQVTYPNYHGTNGQVLGTTGSGELVWLNSSDIVAHHTQELEEQVASLQKQLKSQQEELLAIVQSQQEQIAQLQRMVEHQFAAR